MLKAANAFDKLHKDAHTPPPKENFHVRVGCNSRRLLNGFEQKEAEARAKPVLRDVRNGDLKQSKLYGKLREFEQKDEAVRLEQSMVKTFSERQREMGATDVQNVSGAV